MPAVAPRFRAGEGEPLLLLHAAMLNWQLWTPVLDRLTAERDVLAPTLLGHHGGPGYAGALPTVEDTVDHLESEVDAAGFGTVDIVGNSLGGWCALELARRGRARRVVALAPVGMHTEGQAVRWMRQFKSAQSLVRRTKYLSPAALSLPSMRRRSLALIAVHGDRLPAELVRQLGQAVAGSDFPRLFESAIASGVPTIENAEEIRVPTRFLWGTADALVSRDQVDRYLAALPDVSFAELDGLGHCPQLDDPARISAEILEFCRPE